MTEPVYVRVAGVPYRFDNPAAAKQALGTPGAEAMGADEAREAAGAREDLNYVHDNYGAVGEAGLGALSGATLGLAPGYLASIGAIDPNHVGAAQASPWYTAGDVAGTVVPGILSGGEGFLGRAMASTPAGLMARAGGVAERIAGGVLGESAGLLGRAAATPVQMAARGATEGAIINLGHTVGQGMLTNQPLSAEALWASGIDGALGGGLLGAGIGTVGALGGLAVDGVQSLGKKVIGGTGAKGMATIGRSLGDDFAKGLSEDLPGNKKLIGSAHDILQKGGADFGDSVQTKIRATETAESVYKGTRQEAISDLTQKAPNMAPSLDRISGRLESTIVGPRELTPGAERAQSVVNKFLKSLTNDAEDVKLPTKAEFEYSNSQKPLHNRQTYEQFKSSRQPPSEPLTWEKLVQARDQLSEEVGRHRANPLLGDKLSIKSEILNALDDEINKAATDAGKMMGLDGVAEKYGSSTAGMKLASEIRDSLGKKYSKELLSTEHGIGLNTHDATSFAFSAAMGHPLGAMGILGAKAVSRQLGKKLEPWMSQMAYNNAFGTKAAGATLSVKKRIGESLSRFFKSASQTPYKASQVVRAEQNNKSGGLKDRAEYEAAANRMEQLVSNAHQERVRMYAQQVAEQGYPDMAMQLLDTNSKAVNYVMYNMPARQGTKGLVTTRKVPVSRVPTDKEYRMERIWKGASKPLSLLDDMEKGSLSSDSVRAMKYVYPELHSEIVSQAQQQIYDMKARGDYLPMDKVYMLGAVLGEPIDRTLEPDYVGSVQMALATPQEPPPGQSPPQQANIPLINTQDLQTPLQKAMNI